MGVDIVRCPPEFRDGMVFKKDGEIVDAWSLCFECSAIHSMNSGSLYSDGDFYEQLEKYLETLGHDVRRR